MKDFDVKALPFWARVPGLWKYHKILCFFGLHVPVRLEYPISGNDQVICQECLKPMTLDDWKKFFGR
jgi:hypothetical protein